MYIDLHTHTNPYSPCSTMTAQDLIERAIEIGLNTLCVTDHLTIEGANEAQRLGKEMGIRILRGVEARSSLGDLLVFGCYRDFAEGVSGEEVCRTARETGGVVIPAHPFRVGGGWALNHYLTRQGLDLSPALSRCPELQCFAAVEVLNSQCTSEQNRDAKTLADILNLPGIGGSDAHSTDRVATCMTYFPGRITSDGDLVAALRSGRYQPVDMRNDTRDCPKTKDSSRAVNRSPTVWD